MQKKIKQISALLLACILIFSMTACAKKRTPKEVLQASITKSKDMTSADMAGKAKYKIESSTSSSMNFTMAFTAKVVDSNKDTMKMSMDTSMSVLGQSINFKMYYSDGYYYMNGNGTKQKIKMNISDMKKQVENITGSSSIPAKYYTDLKLSEYDGNQVLSYKLSKDGLNKYVNSLLAQAGSLTGSSDATSETMDESIKISSFSGKRTLDKDDNILKESVKMVMESSTGEDGKITISMDISYKDPGKKVTVTLPDDLDSYQEDSSSTAQ